MSLMLPSFILSPTLTCFFMVVVVFFGGGGVCGCFQPLVVALVLQNRNVLQENYIPPLANQN